jgi:AbiV family abortive infection protein
MTDTNDFRRAVLENARRLISDAQILLEHGSAASTLALATLASEELGKIAYTEITGSPATPRAHGSKLMAAAFGAGHEPDPADLHGDPEAMLQRAMKGYEMVYNASRDAHRLRLQAMYVDVEGDNITTPADITADQARTALAEAERQLSLHEGET